MTQLASDPEVRVTGLGGSDIARILGLSRFGGPMAVWLEKRRLAAPLLETAPMRWGKLLEEAIAREYAQVTGRRVQRVKQTVRHPSVPFLFAHLDRKSFKKGEPPRVLECKTANQFMVSDFGEPGSDQVPDDYLLQVQHYLGVTGYETADLAVLIGGQTFRVFTIPRDGELVAEIEKEAVRFWTEHVETGVPPEVDGSAAWREYAESRFTDAGLAVPITESIERLAYAYEAAKAAEQAAADAKKEASTMLLVELGEASIAEGNGVKVRHSVVHARYPNYKAIIEEARVPAAIVEEHTRLDEQHRISVSIKPA